MNGEEKEKQLASRLGEYVDGRKLETDEDPELLAEAGAVLSIRGALGDTPELDPLFSDTLRARLVRETRKRAAAQKPFYRRAKWMQFAVAAAFFIFFLPVLWTIRELAEKNKMALIEKYDKMYVPYTARPNKEAYLKNHARPFSDRRMEKSLEMSRKWRRKRAEEYLDKYRKERRSGK